MTMNISLTQDTLVAPKPLTFFSVLRFAAHYWQQQPRKLALIISLLAAASFIETYLPSALSDFLKAIRLHTGEASVFRYLTIFLGAYLAQESFFAITFLIYNNFETRIFKALIDDVFTHVYGLPEKFFVSTFTGSIISKIHRAREKIEVFEDQVLLRIFPTFIILIGSTAFLAWHFPALALLLLGYLVIFIVVSAFFVFKVSGPAQGKYADEQDGFGANLADSIGGIATAKSYAQEKYEISRFRKITDILRRKNLRAYLLGNTAAIIQRLLLVGMLVILLGGGTWYLFHGKANLESMAYLVLAYNIIQSYIRELGENVKNLLTSSYDLHAVIKLLQETPEAPAVAVPALQIQRGAIFFDNVTFTYPGKAAPIFKNFSVSIQAGERVALVGHSGSGKTTFIRLLQHLYPTQEGSIYIDGQDIEQHSHLSLRSAISLVPQDPILFHRTLRENIAYGKPTATLDEIKLAAEQAHIGEFIANLPHQYETLVGERGIKLSGGERQRVAIARAILANRPILILDEATSSLDSASERAIQEALYSLIHGRTSIMIAHRLSTILDADRILVFDQGKIVEEGTHYELVHRKNGIYAEFFKLQSVNI
jgi:ATP-binding cassette subfamily B protein